MALILVAAPWQNRPVHAFPSNGTTLDSFNRGNETPLGTSSSGDVWSTTTITGTNATTNGLKVVTNHAEQVTNATVSQYLNTNNYGPDSEMYVTVSGTGSAASGEILALYVRLTGAGTGSYNGYELEVDKTGTSNWVAWQVHNGAFNELGVLGSTTGARKSQAISAGDSVGVKVTGTGATITVEAWYKAVAGSWTSLGTWTDSSANRKTAAGKFGLELQGAATSVQADDLGGGTVVSNVVPAAPTLSIPTNGATGVGTQPTFQLRTTDADNDYLRYKIDVCSTSNCSVIVHTIDQTSSQIGWDGQDTQANTAYIGSSSIGSSTMAKYKYQFSDLAGSTTYYWRGYAVDPGGVNTFSTASSIFSFTTTALSGSGSFPTNTTLLDNFNRTSCSFSSGGACNTASGGGTWGTSALSTNSCVLDIVGNVNVTGHTSAQFCANDLSGSYGPDVEVYATVSTVGSTGGDEIAALEARIQNPTSSTITGYQLEVDQGGQWSFIRVNSSSTLVVMANFTSGGGAPSVANGDMIGFSVTGTANPVLTAWYKSGGSWTMVGTFTDNFSDTPPASQTPFQQAGQIALEVRGTAPRVDDLSGGTAGTTHPVDIKGGVNVKGGVNIGN